MLMASTPFAFYHFLWFGDTILDLCMCKDHAATKSKSEVTVKMACRPTLNYQQTAGTNSDESDRGKRPNRVSHAYVHSPQTAVPHRGHRLHRTSDPLHRWGDTPVPRSCLFPHPSRMQHRIPSQFTVTHWPIDCQSFYLMWWCLIDLVSLTD